MSAKAPQGGSSEECERTGSRKQIRAPFLSPEDGILVVSYFPLAGARWPTLGAMKLLGERESANENRLERERRMVEEGIALWKKKLQQQWLQKIREQREAREMLALYSPWGKPGSGAPNPASRKKRLLEPQLDINTHQEEKSVLTMGRPGNGAPARTSSGRVRTYIHADPTIRFQPQSSLKKCVENKFRYRSGDEEKFAYRLELEKMIAEKQKAQQREFQKERELERKLLHEPSPWGRPGPGGSPWRKPHEIGLNFFESLGWSNDKMIQQEKQDFDTKQPTATNQGVELVPLLWQARVGKPRRDNSGSLLSHPLCTTDVTKPFTPRPGARQSFLKLPAADSTNYLHDLSCQTSHGNNKSQLRKEEVESSIRHFQTWDQFWGRPGHGAPRPNGVQKRNLFMLLHRPQELKSGVS